MAQSEYFGLALKAEIEARPRGFRNTLAKETGIQAAQISNIISGRAYGSEERRRTLAQALGWDYEEFLRYGKSIAENKPYKRQALRTPAPDANSYYAIPFHKKVMKAGIPGGNIFVPDETENYQPILLNKKYLDKQIDSAGLAAFIMPDNRMEPTIAKGRIVIIDTSQRNQNHGSIFLIANEQGRFTVNRVQVNGGDIYLLNDNPQYSAELLKSPWGEVAVGRIIWTWVHQHE